MGSSITANVHTNARLNNKENYTQERMGMWEFSIFPA